MARLVRHDLNRGNVLEGPLRDPDSERWKPRVPSEGIHALLPIPAR
jgi:hypothetical protein